MTMKRIHPLALVLSWLLVSPSARAAHQTFLRGILITTGAPSALFEIHHSFGPPINARSSIINTSWHRAGEKFEDATLKGFHFTFEVLEIDLAKETVKTREAGEEHIYSLPVQIRPATVKGWIHLQDAGFNEIMDLYADCENRVLLLHPAIDCKPVSLEAAWTNQGFGKAEFSAALVKHLDQSGISKVADGDKFLQLIPSVLKTSPSPRSKDLPAGAVVNSTWHFMNVEAGRLADVYAAISGRRRTGNEPIYARPVSYFVSRPLSKPELVYGFETLLAWNNVRIVLGDDNTFSIVQAGKQNFHN